MLPRPAGKGSCAPGGDGGAGQEGWEAKAAPSGASLPLSGGGRSPNLPFGLAISPLGDLGQVEERKEPPPSCPPSGKRDLSCPGASSAPEPGSGKGPPARPKLSGLGRREPFPGFLVRPPSSIPACCCSRQPTLQGGCSPPAALLLFLFPSHPIQPGREGLTYRR